MPTSAVSSTIAATKFPVAVLLRTCCRCGLDPTGLGRVVSPGKSHLLLATPNAYPAPTPARIPAAAYGHETLVPVLGEDIVKPSNSKYSASSWYVSHTHFLPHASSPTRLSLKQSKMESRSCPTLILLLLWSVQYSTVETTCSRDLAVANLCTCDDDNGDSFRYRLYCNTGGNPNRTIAAVTDLARSENTAGNFTEL